MNTQTLNSLSTPIFIKFSIRLILSLTTSLMLFLAPIAANAQEASPTNVVETMVGSILTLLGEDFSISESRPQIKTAIATAFDSRTMAQSVLANNWKKANPAQKDKFEELFAQTLENTYIGRLENYTNELVEYNAEKINKNRASVETLIITANANIPVNYKLRLRKAGWLIYDVEVENVSLISSYRDTYRSIVRRSGVDDLLTQMEDKLKELEQSP